MAEITEKTATTSKAKKTAATTNDVAAVSSNEVNMDVVKDKNAADRLETRIIEEFKKEFKGLPTTELSIIVRCGDRRTATYQEIELPCIKGILDKYRG